MLRLNRGARALAYNKTRLQGTDAPYDLNLYREDAKNFDGLYIALYFGAQQ